MALYLGQEKVNVNLKGSIDYKAGVEAGHKVGYDEGYEVGRVDGQQSEYDKFWDNLQRNGAQSLYRYAFHGTGWNDKNFTPKYDIVFGTYSSGVFWCTNITDLVAALDRANVRLDTSKGSYMDTCFAGGSLTRVPEISLVSATSYAALFLEAYALVEIQKLTLKEDGSQALGNIMIGCTSLKHITLAGMIGGSSNLKDCPLTADSVQSIIDHLMDLTGTATQTITFKADVGASLTDEQKATITAKNWTLVY